MIGVKDIIGNIDDIWYIICNLSTHGQLGIKRFSLQLQFKYPENFSK